MRLTTGLFVLTFAALPVDAQPCSEESAVEIVGAAVRAAGRSGASRPAIVVENGSELYRGFWTFQDFDDPAVERLFREPDPRLAAADARAEAPTIDETAARARALLKGERRALVAAINTHTGWRNKESPWVSTTTSLERATQFVSPSRTATPLRHFVVRFRAPSGSISIAEAQKRLDGVTAFREEEVLVPGGIPPAEILEVQELTRGDAGWRVARRWRRTSTGAVVREDAPDSTPSEPLQPR